MNKQLEDNVVEYVESWLQNGAGSQSYDVFSKLALIMPLPCTETICIRRIDKDIELLTTYREVEIDWAFGGFYHSIGSAHMLANYINKYANVDILKLFPTELIEKVKSDKSWWNLKSHETVILRIFRKELGFSDETILNIFPSIIFAGVDHTLTTRGGESAFIYLVDLSEYQKEIKKEVVWMDVKTLSERNDFLSHQIPRVEMALKKFKT